MPIFQAVKEKIKYAISHNFEVSSEKIYLTHPTFFSEITGKKAVTVHDEYWHPHVDKVLILIKYVRTKKSTSA